MDAQPAAPTSASAGHGHGHGHGHTHDGIDWAERLTHLRRADALDHDSHLEVARRLAGALPDGATVLDIGSGAGGMSAAFAEVLAERGGGRVVVVDAVPELLDAAQANTRAAGDAVEVEAVLADATDEALPGLVPEADLVWAAGVVHHLPDQQRGVETLVRTLRTLRPGGRLALREGGLSTRCLPWDLGLGAPGLQDRLIAARDTWFAGMRSGMARSVPLPGGWGRALRAAGLGDTTSFSYLVDHPAPAPQPVRDSVVDWMTFMAQAGADWLSDADRTAIEHLLDPASPDFLGDRDDVFILSAATVHVGTRPTDNA